MYDMPLWWDTPQQFDGPAGSFLRTGDTLQFRQTPDDDFGPIEGLSGPYLTREDQVVFDFRSPNGLTGTLGCTAGTCVVYLHGEVTNYTVTNNPQSA